jgi:uncharacterized membrane protein
MFLVYLAVAVPFWIADALWLGVLARRFYREALGDLMAPRVSLLPAALFYVVYPVGLVWFALGPLGGHGTPWHAFGFGALFGLFCYGTYDLVNQATLRGWPWRLTLVDMTWGTLASGFAIAVAERILG